jgi:hypothetical protein
VKLADVQRAFGEAIRSPSTVSGDVAGFVGPGARSPAAQLETYREQFWWRHLGCMIEDFPALQAVVGEDAFATLCERYFAVHPPASFLLRDLGARFAEFLEQSGEPRLVCDLARVEWAFVDAFDAADAPPLDPASLGAMGEDDWPRAVLTLQPSLILLSLAYPAEDVRATFRREGKVLRPEPAPTTMAVYRRDLLLYAEPLEPAAHALLVRLQKGEQLGVASEAVAAEHPGAPLEAKLGEWFSRWTALGWVSAVRVAP